MSTARTTATSSSPSLTAVRGPLLPGPSVLPGPRLTAVLLVAFPLAEIVEAALSPLAGSSTAADLAGIAAHPSRFVLSVLIGLSATLLAIPAFLGLTNACVRRAPRLARVSAWTSVASMCGFVAVRAVQGVELQVTREGLDAAAAARLIDHVSANPVLAPLTVMFLAGTVVGIALLAVATWRSGFPRPAVLLLLAFPLVEVANFSGGQLGTVVSHVVLLVALGWLGRTLWLGGSAAQTPGSRASRASAEAGIQAGAPSSSR